MPQNMETVIFKSDNGAKNMEAELLKNMEETIAKFDGVQECKIIFNFDDSENVVVAKIKLDDGFEASPKMNEKITALLLSLNEGVKESDITILKVS